MEKKGGGINKSNNEEAGGGGAPIGEAHSTQNPVRQKKFGFGLEPAERTARLHRTPQPTRPITGRPLIGRHPSAHKPTKPFLFICFSPLRLESRPWKWWGGGWRSGVSAASPAAIDPLHLRFRGVGLQALPSPPPTPTRGPGGRRPRPRGGCPGARGLLAATQWRPRQAPRAPAAASTSRAGGAGRFQNRPSRWGEGRRTRALELVGPRRVPHTLLGSSIQLSRPPLETNGP